MTTAARSWTTALADVRRRLEFLDTVSGPGRLAERMITAFRDGVPPPVVRPVTVGNSDLRKILSRGALGASRFQANTAFVVVGRSGDGLSHCLQWAREEAAGHGLATLTLNEGFPLNEVDRLQAAILEKSTVGERTLMDVLSKPPGRTNRAAAMGRVHHVASQLTAGGLLALQLLFENANQNHHDQVLELLTWIRGEVMPTAWRRRYGLPARALLAPNVPGLATGILTLLEIFGIKGLGVSVEEATEAQLHAFMTSFRAPGIFLVAATPNQRHNARGALALSPLDLRSRQSLAIIIRDLHVHAYEWKRLGAVSPDRLNEWVLLSVDGTSRDLVRDLVARLDSVLARA